MTSFAEMLDTKAVLVLDGGMGTELFARGLDAGQAPELWNVENPDAVAAIHEAYIAAGSDMILTNSFGGTSFRLALHGLDTRVHELNKAAAEVARRAADAAGRPVLVAGSMGPTGELLEPMGSMTPDACTKAYAEQAAGLAAGGADVLWIETLSDLDEVEAAIAGARETTDLPVCATLSFDTAGRTMMGVTGAEACSRLSALGVAAVGANCGNNLRDTEAAVAEMLTENGDIPIIAKANAGIPEWKGDGLTYDGTPEVMGAYANRLRAAGVRLIGSCCGSGPEHIAFIRGVIDGTIEAPDIAPPDRAAAVGHADPRQLARRRRRRSR